MSLSVTMKVEMMSGEIHAGSDTLLLQVRGALTAQGTSLSAWCRKKGVDRAHAHRVLKGATNGKKARDLREILIAAASGDGR